MTRATIPAILLFVGVSFAQPYQPHVIWDRHGETDSSSYGTQILPLGDQNNDGFSDWAVMAWGNIGYGGTQSAYLEFFHGGDTLSQYPYLVYHGNPDVYSPSWSVLSAGDVNRDGYQDWLVWAWPVSHPSEYLLPIYFGGPQADTLADAYVPTNSHSAIYAIGDFNGDGFADLYTYDENTDVGRAYFGGSPMDTIPDWIIWQPPPGINQTIPFAVGDFNGDGASDFLCRGSSAVIFLGGTYPDTLPAYTWTVPGSPIGGVLSLNGDPYDELIFGGDNVVYVYYGDSVLQPALNTTIHFSCTYTLRAVSAGDFNHDGFNDLLMWNDQCDGNMFGALTLHLGHPWLNPDPAFTIQGDWPDGLINIYAAAGLGDVNGDSLDDFAVGAWDDFAYLGWRGRCIVIAGDDSLLAGADDARPDVPKELSMEAYPNPFNSEATVKLQSPSSRRSTTLTVFNVLGRAVRSEALPPFSGEYTYQFHANGLPSGLYLIHVQSGYLQVTQKLMLLK